MHVLFTSEYNKFFMKNGLVFEGIQMKLYQEKCSFGYESQITKNLKFSPYPIFSIPTLLFGTQGIFSVCQRIFGKNF